MFAAVMNRPRSVLLAAALILSSLGAWGSPVFAADPAPAAKGPEVSTVGTNPNVELTPEELAKVALMAATPPALPAPAKEPAASTITMSGGNILTAEELAKEALIPAPPDSLPVPAMPKLETMKVAKDGIPVLTAQELEKRARELMGLDFLVPNAPQPAPKAGR